MPEKEKGDEKRWRILPGRGCFTFAPPAKKGKGERHRGFLSAEREGGKKKSKKNPPGRVPLSRGRGEGGQDRRRFLLVLLWGKDTLSS